MVRPPCSVMGLPLRGRELAARHSLEIRQPHPSSPAAPQLAKPFPQQRKSTTHEPFYAEKNVTFLPNYYF